MNKNKQNRIFQICLNSKCTSKSRCLNSITLQSHPQQCLYHIFPVQTINDKKWEQIQNYPNDQLGKTVKQKLSLANNQSYISYIIQKIRKKLLSIINQMQKSLLVKYPPKQLQHYYEDVYRLDKISYLLKNKSSPQQINKLIKEKFQSLSFNSLNIINQTYALIQKSFNNTLKIFQQQVSNIISSFSKKQQAQLENLPVIQFGLYKSKHISSQKIVCTQGQVIFPKLNVPNRFLPWVYSQNSFNQGDHLLKITFPKYPLQLNCGFCILQQSDKDVYPYLIHKSIFSKQIKHFQLIQGSQIQSFVSQRSILKLRMQFDREIPRATISDTSKRCFYQCFLQKEKKYRMGLYGSGWSVIIIQLR